MSNLFFPLDNEPPGHKYHVIFILGLPAFGKALGIKSALNKCSFMYE